MLNGDDGEVTLEGPVVSDATAVSEKGLVRPSLQRTRGGLVLRCVAIAGRGKSDNAYDAVDVSYTVPASSRREAVVVPIVITR